MIVKHLVFTAKERAEFLSRPLADPGPGRFKVKNSYSLVSPGTELALYTGSHVGFTDPDITWARYPLDAGYASVGVVEESGIEGLTAGETIMHYGCHAPTAVVDSASTHWAKVPKDLDPRLACFARFAQIAYSGYAALDRPSGDVLVYGAGIVGNLAAQWMKLRGANSVKITDLSRERLNLASQCGLEPAGTETFEPDTIVEATGAPGVVQEALARVKVGGQVSLLGSTRGTVDINVYKYVHRKALSVVGAHETVLGDGVRAALEDSLGSLLNGGLVVAPLHTHTIQPEELPGAYPRLLAEPDTYIGILVDWSTWHD